MSEEKKYEELNLYINRNLSKVILESDKQFLICLKIKNLLYLNNINEVKILLDKLTLNQYKFFSLYYKFLIDYNEDNYANLKNSYDKLMQYENKKFSYNKYKESIYIIKMLNTNCYDSNIHAQLLSSKMPLMKNLAIKMEKLK